MLYAVCCIQNSNNGEIIYIQNSSYEVSHTTYNISVWFVLSCFPFTVTIGIYSIDNCNCNCKILFFLPVLLWLTSAKNYRFLSSSVPQFPIFMTKDQKIKNDFDKNVSNYCSILFNIVLFHLLIIYKQITYYTGIYLVYSKLTFHYIYIHI